MVFRQVKVGFRSNRGSLQLAYSHEGKQYYVSLGLKDTPKNRAASAASVGVLSDLVSTEIVKGQFDPEAIKAKFLGKDIKMEKPEEISLLELWEQFQAHKVSLTATSTHREYELYLRCLKRCPHGFEAPEKIQAWAIANLSHEVARRWLNILSACCKWGCDRKLVASAPFEKLKIKKPRNARRREPKPFTAEEISKILEVFGNTDHLRHYYRLVKFLLLVGCRPSEALALRWGKVSATSILFDCKVTTGPDYKLTIEPGLKREPSRRIPAPPQVLETLGDRGKKDELVFPAKNGGILGWDRFAQKVWRPALEKAGVEHRNPYQMRHTFASQGVTQIGALATAKLIGNCAKTTLDFYARHIGEAELPSVVKEDLDK